MIRKIIFISLFSFITLIFSNLSGQLRFSPLETDISLSLVNAIHRDHEGFLWIGNEELGLMRYNSQNITRYKHDESNQSSICNDAISAIKEDLDHTIWIGTSKGLSRYIPNSDSFTNYYHNESDTTSLSNNYIESIFVAPSGQVWILTANGICKYDKATDRFIRYNMSLPHHSNYFCEMTIDKDGTYWLVTLYSGVYKFISETETFIHYPDQQMGDQFAMTKKILIDSDDTIWVGSYEYGVAQFNRQTGVFSYLPRSNDSTGINSSLITSLLEWEPGTILMGFDQGGINLFDKKTQEVTHITSENHKYGQLSSDGVYCMHKDQEGILWVGTSRGGISYFSEKAERFRSYSRKESYPMHNGLRYPTPSYNICGCFYEDATGTIWIGTDGGGLNAFNRETLEFIVYKHDVNNTASIQSNVIRGITEDEDGNILVATLDKGVFAFNRITQKFTPSLIEKDHRSDYQSSFLWSIFRDSKYRIWTSNPKGYVSVYDQTKKLIGHHYIKISYTLDQKILFCEDSQGHIYFNSQEGVYRYSEEKDVFELIIELPRVSFINASHPNHLWIGTERTGLYQFNKTGKMIRHFTSKDGLADNYICAIISGNNNELWITTNNGLSKFDTLKGIFINYTRQDGLIDNQFFIQSYLKTHSNQILLGTSKGFTSFDPNNIRINMMPPETYISNMYINNELVDFRHSNSPIDKPIRYISEIILSHNQRTISFDFNAINYTFPEKNRYQFLLDGFEEKWETTSALHKQAHYTNLDPGQYTFKVKAANNDGIWNKEPVHLKVIIQPPFWKTKWFLTSFSILLTIVTIFIVKLRERKLIRAKTILQNKVNQRTQVIEDQKEELLAQHDELVKHREQLENLVVERTHDLIRAKEKAEKSDRLKSYFLANLSHEIRTPMNAIIGFASLLIDPSMTLEQQKDFVSLITSNSESLLYLIEDILDFSMIESDQLKVMANEFELDSFIDHIYSSFALRNTNPDIEMHLDNKLKGKHIKLNSDEFRIKQIMDNLISNALKFTDAGHIKLTVKFTTKHLLFCVSDTGHGISANDQKNIFDQFVKLEVDQFSAKRGLGLGLAISKRLAQLLDGQLLVESKLEKGSVFTLALPSHIIQTDKIHHPIYTTAQNPEHYWQDKSILIIEDEKSNYLFLWEVLKSTKAKVFWAKDGLTALELYHRGEKFDLVLLDIKMPNMDGYTVLKHIRKLEPSQIVIAQTAYARKEDQWSIMEKGFTDYLPKPMNQKMVLQKLSKYLS